jgi:hypothetical protein
MENILYFVIVFSYKANIFREIIKNLRAATASKRKPSVEIIERLISNKIMAIVSAKQGKF